VNAAADATELIELLDWKRRVFAVYAAVRAADDAEGAWRRWRAARDELFRTHPSSPLPAGARGAFPDAPFFPYDPGLRVLAEIIPAPARRSELASSGAETIAFERFACARFELAGSEQRLELYWLSGYGGGLFLPFCDATSGRETYGGGRYVLDTIKGADLGLAGDRLVVDFNFAYNPSCSYDPRWVCPLAPPANRLAAAIHAGERTPGRPTSRPSARIPGRDAEAPGSPA
jgi:uncharacterized protein (DUF1684 family)